MVENSVRWLCVYATCRTIRLMMDGHLSSCKPCSPPTSASNRNIHTSGRRWRAGCLAVELVRAELEAGTRIDSSDRDLFQQMTRRCVVFPLHLHHPTLVLQVNALPRCMTDTSRLRSGQSYGCPTACRMKTRGLRLPSSEGAQALGLRGSRQQPGEGGASRSPPSARRASGPGTSRCR
jgi:hypothetical protein